LPAQSSDSWGTVPPAEDGPGAEEYGAYDEDDDWEEEPEAAADPPAPVRRRRNVVLAAAVAVALVAVAAGVLGWMLLKEDYALRSETSTVVPFRAEMPADWQRQVGSGSDVVWAPAPERAADLFFDQGSPDAWTRDADVVRSPAPENVWLHASGLRTQPDTTSVEALGDFLQPYVPDQTDFGSAHRAVTIAGLPADELEGVTFDPANPGTRLHALVDVVHSPGEGTLVLAFFAPAASFDEHLPTFQHIRGSVQIGG
jgi:hypothetical protein